MTQTDADITARGEGEVGDTDHQSRESQGDTCEWETWGDAEPDDHDCCSPKPGIHFFCLSSLVSLTILMTVFSLTILHFLTSCVSPSSQHCVELHILTKTDRYVRVPYYDKESANGSN